jgi:hypothetical protein
MTPNAPIVKASPVTRAALLQSHYLGDINPMREITSHTDGDAIACWGIPVRGNIRMGFRTLELMRLWSPDDYSGVLSHFLASSIKLVRAEHPEFPLLMSLADPSQGHHGGIYQATNWVYGGLSASGGPSFIIIDGVRWHPRKVGHRFGHCDPTRLRESGYTVETIPRIRKYVYWYPQTRVARKTLNTLSGKEKTR